MNLQRGFDVACVVACVKKERRILAYILRSDWLSGAVLVLLDGSKAPTHKSVGSANVVWDTRTGVCATTPAGLQ